MYGSVPKEAWDSEKECNVLLVKNGKVYIPVSRWARNCVARVQVNNHQRSTVVIKLTFTESPSMYLAILFLTCWQPFSVNFEGNYSPLASALMMYLKAHFVTEVDI